MSREVARLPAQAKTPHVRAVVFDVGETLIDETTEYGTWADWLGIPRHTFSAMFGAVIARGEDYRQTFQHFRPGFDLAAERLRREQADFPPGGGHRGYAAMVDGSGMVACCCSHSMGGR
jgi:FMN phosphatase YigB (HAD superfamily)